MITPNLVEIHDARVHVRADDTDSDEWFEFWIPLVSELIASWLGDTWRLYELLRDENGVVVTDEKGTPIPMRDVFGEPIINRLVRGAALVELADIYANREGESRRFMENGGNGAWGYTLCAGATAILQGIRKSRLA